jgi:hypothetical protein
LFAEIAGFIVIAFVIPTAVEISKFSKKKGGKGSHTLTGKSPAPPAVDCTNADDRTGAAMAVRSPLRGGGSAKQRRLARRAAARAARIAAA